MDAIKAKVGHADLVRNQEPNVYGLWLTLYTFNEEGRNNVFRGAKYIYLGDPKTGGFSVTPQRKYTIDCGDLIVEYTLNSIKWNRHSNPSYSGNFDGTIEISAYLKKGNLSAQLEEAVRDQNNYRSYSYYDQSPNYFNALYSYRQWILKRR